MTLTALPVTIVDCRAMAAEIDWPLTLAWWGVVLAFLAVVAGAIAAVYAKLSYRLQKRQEATSAAGIAVSDEELQVLRLLDGESGMIRGYYARGQSSTSTWRMRASDRYVAVQADELENGWFFATLETLKGRGLGVWDHPTDWWTLTNEGRAVVRLESGRTIRERRIVFYPRNQAG